MRDATRCRNRMIDAPHTLVMSDCVREMCARMCLCVYVCMNAFCFATEESVLSRKRDGICHFSPFGSLYTF